MPRAWRPLSREPLLYVMAGLLLGGAWLLWRGIVGFGIAHDMEGPPTVLTCAELEAHGPGPSLHVRVTDLFVCDASVAVDVTSSQPYSPSTYTYRDHSWLAIVPFDSLHAKEARAREAKVPNAPRPSVPHVRVLVKSSRQRSWLDGLFNLDWLSDHPSNAPPKDPPIEGQILNGHESVPYEVEQTLRLDYPGLDASSCWLIEEGGVTLGTDGYATLIGFAVFLLGLSAFLARRLARLRAAMA